MSADKNLSEEQFKHVWKRAKDPQFGHNIEVSDTPHGRYVVDGSGYGRMRWSVVYPDGDYAITDTRGDARANADIDLKERAERKARQGGDQS